MHNLINHYPKFEADEVLTNEHLNNLFDYLDAEGRLTRVNLIGIGIVCGLDVTFNKTNDGRITSIEIGKGCGVTSEGYLLVMDEKQTYTYKSDYDAKKERMYDKFASKTQLSPPAAPPEFSFSQLFQIWQLQVDTTKTADGQTPSLLSELPAVNAINDYVVLLFAELLEVNNKNCIPTTCDDKGIDVQVSVKPLLVNKAAAASLTANTSGQISSNSFNELPVLKMPRWNVPNSSPLLDADIANAYRSILSSPLPSSFIGNVQAALEAAYNAFSIVLGNDLAFSPNFLTGPFAFIQSLDSTQSQGMHIQYFYDFFCDIIEGYEEFRKTGMEIMSNCCPNSTLFARHLLLGESNPQTGVAQLAYRHYFIYSPLFERENLTTELRSLFRRLKIMINGLQIPAQNVPNIKITPSKTGEALSEKAIPYYYNPLQLAGQTALYEAWNFSRFMQGKAKQNLSYNAVQYNTPASPVREDHDWVINPLHYDLEPYDFFRIEGHIGKPVGDVITDLRDHISLNRLPFHFVALASGSSVAGVDLADDCRLPEIQMQYELLRDEMRCCIDKGLSYWGGLVVKDSPSKYVGSKLFVGNVYESTVTYQAHLPEYSFSNLVPMMRNTSALSGTAGAEEVVSVARPGSERVTRATGMEMHASETMASNITKSAGTKFLNQSNPDSIGVLYNTGKVRDIKYKDVLAPREYFSASVVSHYALIIIDELNGIDQALEAETVTDLDLAALENHVHVLEQAYKRLGELLDSYIRSQRLYFQIKGRVNEVKAGYINKIAEVMPNIDEDDAYKIMLLVVHTTDASEANEATKISTLVELLRQEPNDENKSKIIDAAYQKKDILVIPENKDVNYAADDALLEMRDLLKNYNCLCGAGEFKILQEALKKRLEELKRVHLFSTFTAKHPGIQHKAGVSTGGTFIIVYNPNNTVFADFYLPYVISSDCTPVQIVINEAPPNQKPVADAGDPILFHTPRATLASITLSGSGSDPDGDQVTLQWSEANGQTGFTITNPTAATTTVTNLPPGDYVFKLTVTDTKGENAEDTVEVTVNQIPVVSVNDAAIADWSPENKEAVLEAVANDPENGTISYLWSLASSNDQGKVTLIAVADNPAKIKVTVTQPGSYGVKLIVTDDKAATATAIATVRATAREFTCGDLPAIVKEWTLLQVPADFAKKYELYKSTTVFLKQAAEITAVDSQLKYFEKAEERLSPSMKQLSNLELQSEDQLLLRIKLYSILVELIMYIACLRKEDSMEAIINPVLELFQKFATEEGSLSDKEKEVLQELRKQLTKALKNADPANEKYVEILNNLAAVLKDDTPTPRGLKPKTRKRKPK